MNVLLEIKILKGLRGLKRMKNKLKEAKHFVVWAYAVVFRKERVREIVDQVASVHLRILGRYPDDKRRYIKGILTGTVPAYQMEKELLGTAEYEERIRRFCRMYGNTLDDVRRGVTPGLFPGDASFKHEDVGYQHLKSCGKDENVRDSSVSLVSTWGIRCGIATYTGYLAGALRRAGLLTEVVPLHHGKPSGKINGTIAHFQHEFGILPKAVDVPKKILITWHTVKENMRDAVRQFESTGNVVGHIVHSEEAAHCLRDRETEAEVHVIHHGSKIIPPVRKEDARELLGLGNLGIKKDDVFGFVFGFQSGDKMYEEIIEATRKAGIKLVISGAVHECGHVENITVKDHVVFLGKFLSDTEIDLWALSSDLLLFDYKKQKHYSVSGALHRLIGAGRPVVCSRTKHFTDLREDEDVLKFEGPEELEQKIREALGRKEALGKKALEYAAENSWENAVKKHINIYKRHTGLSSLPDRFDAAYYDKNYFAVKNGKSFENGDGSIGHWSYANPEGEWMGCAPIVRAWKELLEPKKVLDVGCGRGTFIGYFREAGVEAVGFDFSSFAVDHPYAKCEKAWIRQWDAVKTPWPYKDQSFDLVVALDLLEHIYEEDVDRVIDELYRVTGRYAFFQIATVHGSSGTGIHDEGYALKKGEAVPAGMQGCAVAGHVTIRDAAYWMEKLKRDGWAPRRDLVEQFCGRVPKEVIANWLLNMIVVMEKTF